MLGVDVGGSGAKGAVVDTESGELLTDRRKVRTPEPLPPEELARAIASIVDHHRWDGPVGVALPCVIEDGVTLTAANIHPDWIGIDAAGLIADTVGRPTALLNDADAAGIAEMRLGAGRGASGTVVLLTFGSGIGSAVFADGTLLANTELGHLELHGDDAEHHAAARLKDDLGLSWAQWTDRVNDVLRLIETGLNPRLIIVGGGISKHGAEWAHMLKTRCAVAVAHFTNNAGIVGAALAAQP